MSVRVLIFSAMTVLFATSALAQDADAPVQGDAPARGDAPTVIRGSAPAGGEGSANVLPIEIVFHNMKNADCHPKDAKPADLAKLQKSPACVELAKETEQLKITYRNNPLVLDALADGRLR